RTCMLKALTPSAYVNTFNNCRRFPMLCARRSHSVSSRCRLMLSASLRRRYNTSKSGSPGEI
ncbi:MAG TPA: hypothetical protein VMY16_08780, partial [Ilumatobacteraceae bacterium]|nr:hypothetical protein [Ilumatobacteraceae bacterium]